MSNENNEPDKDLFQYAQEHEFDNLIPPSRNGHSPSETPKASERELIGAGGPPQSVPEPQGDFDKKELQTAYIIANALMNILVNKGIIQQRDLDKEIEGLFREYRDRRR